MIQVCAERSFDLNSKNNDTNVVLILEGNQTINKILIMKTSKSLFSAEFHPGEFIREEFLQAGGQSIFQFAMAMEISEKMACEIIVGQQTITPLIAERLARVYGINSQYWLDMQATYDTRKKLEGLHSN
jgi:addiction module HigA family antidote